MNKTIEKIKIYDLDAAVYYCSNSFHTQDDVFEEFYDYLQGHPCQEGFARTALVRLLLDGWEGI